MCTSLNTKITKVTCIYNFLNEGDIHKLMKNCMNIQGLELRM